MPVYIVGKDKNAIGTAVDLQRNIARIAIAVQVTF